MAQSTAAQGSQPKVGAQRPKPEYASTTAADNAEDASAQADVDVVQQVSRNKDGEPDQSANFRVLVDDDDDADDDEKSIAYNRAGEAQGSKHFNARDGRDADARRKDEEKRLETEAKELRRINRNQD